MSEQSVSDLLERAAERIPVGRPPLPDMYDDARRLRRRRSVRSAVFAAAAVAVAVTGVSLLSGDGEPAGDGLTGPADETGAPIPAGMRLVGSGHLGILVPDEWATNALHCGTPRKDTVIIDQGAVCRALVSRLLDVESVEIYEGWWGGVGEYGSVPTAPLTVDGQAAERIPTECFNGAARPGAVTVCRGVIYFPEHDVSFIAESSTEPGTRRIVDEILTRIRLVPDLVAVPGYQLINVYEQDDNAGQHYLDALHELGLTAEVVTEQRPTVDPGYVLDARPQPGTMLAPGAKITVTLVGAPRGPADEISVGMNSNGPGDSMDYRSLSDAQVKNGATIRLEVGSKIWLYGHGNRSGTLAGELDGDSLVLDDWKDGPNYGRSWQAVRPGTTTITVTIDVDGRPFELGTVRVFVE